MRLIQRLLVVLLGVVSLAAVAGAAPRLTIPVTEFDFGYSPQNSAIGHIFWLHSTGDDTLKIVRVTPGCGCTQTPLQKDRLAAGDSTQLEVIFSTGQYSGQVTKTPRISTNEGPPDKMVRILTNVLIHPDSSYPVVIKPYVIEIQKSGKKGQDEAKFVIQNVSPQTLIPTIVASPSEFLEVVLPKKIGVGKSGTGIIRVKKEFVDKSFGKSFTFELDDQKHTRFTVPVARTLPPISPPAPHSNVAVPVGQH
jgi:hypothetical protein